MSSSTDVSSSVTHVSSRNTGKPWRAACCLILLLCLTVETGFSEEPTRYMVVVTGSEILAGAFPDGHTHFLARTLRPLGLRCVGSMTVDDGTADIQAALRYATARAELVIVTGGLGPTDNDVTREAISEFTGIPVKENADVLAAISERFHTPVDGLRANLRRQTRVPVGGTYLENANGTAVGLVFERGESVIVALPGPPRELQPMVKGHLIPYLGRRFGTHLPGSSLTIRFVGLGQSSIDQRMKEHVTLPEGVLLSSEFDGSRVDFTFSLPEDNGENRKRLDRFKQAMLATFGESVYATDEETTLEDVAVGLLKKRGETLAIAEIASGGSVESAFSGAAEGPEVLAGAYIAQSMESLGRLVGLPHDWLSDTSVEETRLRQLSEVLCKNTTSSWAIVVGPRKEPRDGTPFADVAIRSASGKTTIERVGVRGRDSASRSRLTTQVVDLLRRRLARE